MIWPIALLRNICRRLADRNNRILNDRTDRNRRTKGWS